MVKISPSDLVTRHNSLACMCAHVPAQYNNFYNALEMQYQENNYASGQ